MNWLVITLLLLLLAYALFILWSRNLRYVSKADQKFFLQHWKLLLQEEDGVKQIISADKLLDQMLARKGFRGSLGDKLKRAGKKFTHLNELWSAHKLRNKIAHEVGFHLTERQKNDAIKAFKQAFQDLGYLS